MKNNKQKSYTKATKGMTKKEVVESILISNEKPLSKTEHKEFLKKRLELLNNRTQTELTMSNLLQFKYETETYIELGEFNPKYSFAKCLKRYMKIIDKSSKEMTKDLSIHKTRLSRILNGREEANPILSYKLEKHSVNILPAIFWWKLIAIKKNHEIITNKTDRKKAFSKVKNEIRRRVYG